MKTVLQLFWTFFKIGAFTFGSGYAMIPMIEKEVVDRRKWFDKDDFYDQFALASSAPGPFALNTAVFVGYKLKGWWGSLAAVLGAVLPSFLIVLLIVRFYTQFKRNPLFEGVLKGLRPAVVGLIGAAAVILIVKTTWFQGTPAFAVVEENFPDWKSWILLAAAFGASYWGKASPLLVILAGAILGLMLY